MRRSDEMMDFDEEDGGGNLRAQSCPCIFFKYKYKYKYKNLRAQSCPCIFLLNVSPAILQQKD